MTSILISFGIFLALYLGLRERAKRRNGAAPPMNRGGIGLIAVIVSVVILIGILRTS